MPPDGWRGRADALLLERGAGAIDHPGGTLYEHVGRVADLLGAWGAGPALQAAGLCHACYGTDGFPTALLGLGERDLLIAVVGDEAEEIVYRYANCDRGKVYPRLGDPSPLHFTGRFDGRSGPIDDEAARGLTELTAVNELDLVLVNPDATASWAPAFHQLLRGARHWLSAEALAAWEEASPA
jgi:hypothetical protein